MKQIQTRLFFENCCWKEICFRLMYCIVCQPTLVRKRAFQMPFILNIALYLRLVWEILRREWKNCTCSGILTLNGFDQLNWYFNKLLTDIPVVSSSSSRKFWNKDLIIAIDMIMRGLHGRRKFFSTRRQSGEISFYPPATKKTTFFC